MNFTRAEVRYNCFSMKRTGTAKNPDLIKEVDKVRGELPWDKYLDEWDVVVFHNRLAVFKTIRDVAKVVEVCSFRYVAEKTGIPMTNMTDEESAIIHMIESQFLEEKMTWLNYRTVWNVRWDDERKRIETYLLNVPMNQIPVTEEMIQKVLERGTADSQILFDTVKLSFVETNNKEE